MKVVKVYIQHVYGRPLTYPSNDTAVLFCQLLNKKTLDARDLRIIQDLGFEIEQVLPNERIEK